MVGPEIWGETVARDWSGKVQSWPMKIQWHFQENAAIYHIWAELDASLSVSDSQTTLKHSIDRYQ